MTVMTRDFSNVALRRSLKRGLSRQAMERAVDADLPRLFNMASEMRPNRKARERLALRVQAMRGVVRVALVGEAVVMVVRNRCEAVTRVEGCEAFRETALFYTRVRVEVGGAFHLSRASFCQHALERLVERSPVALDQLLPAVDAEAVALLRNAARAAVILDAGDCYATAVQQGVWAGSLDECGLEPEWDLTCPGAVPLFSARTFLSPEEMRPTVWARWRRDPALSVA